MTADRIAVVYDCLFPYTTGGGERQYRGFAEAFVDLGREVDYLTVRQWPEGEPPSATFSVVPLGGGLDLYDDEGVRRSSSALRFAWRVFRALLARRNRYDAVVVSALPVLNVFAARLALVGSRTTVAADYLEVWGRHQWIDYAGRLTGNVAWALQRAAIALTPLATAHSALTSSRLRKEGFRGQILLSPGLIDGDAAAAESAAEDAASPPSRDEPFVLYAGRHIPDKRVEALPAAVAAVRERYPSLRLVITGRGASTATIEDAVTTADGWDWTTMPGFVSETELRDLMAHASAVVNPSRREGYGLVVVEAAAFGTPTVLVADEGNASTELVQTNVNGFIAASVEPGPLGSAIAAAVAEGEALRRRTREWYSEAIRTRTIRRTVQQLADALDERSAGRKRS